MIKVSVFSKLLQLSDEGYFSDLDTLLFGNISAQELLMLAGEAHADHVRNEELELENEQLRTKIKELETNASAGRGSADNETRRPYTEREELHETVKAINQIMMAGGFDKEFDKFRESVESKRNSGVRRTTGDVTDDLEGRISKLEREMARITGDGK